MVNGPRRVRVFFYGTFMSPAVLAEYGIAAIDVLPARVANFELVIRPRVNLVPFVGSSVYGATASLAHEELARIYGDLDNRFGLKYLPEAVFTETIASPPSLIAALCYIAPHMPPGAANPEYVRELARCVRALNLPEAYALHIESFA